MVGVIITGHGHFAEGLFSALKVIAGEPKQVRAVNFLEGDTSADLERHLEEAAESLAGEQLVFLTDIAGGSPYRQAVLLSRRLPQECRVFSGTNMPFLLKLIFDREPGIKELETHWLGEDIQVQVFHEKKKSVRVQAGGI